jgi:hypothetical protein
MVIDTWPNDWAASPALVGVHVSDTSPNRKIGTVAVEVHVPTYNAYTPLSKEYSL